MLFSAKSKGYFVELSDYGCLFARTSAMDGPLIVEELDECPVDDAEKFSETLKRLQVSKSPSGYLHAVCGLYPGKRIVRRASLDPKRYRDPAYLNEVITQQLRVEPDKFTISVLNSVDGTDFDITKTSQKEALFCGLPADDIASIQDSLLGNGIYPERLELGTVSVLGSLVDYLEFKKSKTPTLVLEISGDSTHSYIVTSSGVETSRPIAQGLEAMIPVVQKELNLKDEDSARKLFYSNTFDFTGMGPLLVKRLLKELQSSIGFYEVQTGQSVGQVLCAMIPPKLTWLENTIAAALGVPSLKLDASAWLQSRQITLSDRAAQVGASSKWFGLFGLMASYKPVAVESNAVVSEKKD